MEDLKGKRIRATGGIILDGLKALGAAPTFLGSAEVYMALQRGTIDAATAGVISFAERKYYKVAKYVTVAHFVHGETLGLMNKDRFNQLPKNIQRIMLEAGKEAQAWNRKQIQNQMTEAIEILRNKGMEVYFLPDGERDRWRQATKVCVDIFLKNCGDVEKGKWLLESAEKLR
jgi:TRAP-type C4-dicarboxylate transport system substrate-binding protein